MSSLKIFDLASKQADWLAMRQKIVAGNIAHSDTPGYRASDLRPFNDVLDRTGLSMAATSSSHIGAEKPSLARASVREQLAWDVKLSGNSVSLDQQLVKANEIHAAYALNTNVVKSFHRMLLSSLKG